MSHAHRRHSAAVHDGASSGAVAVSGAFLGLAVPAGAAASVTVEVDLLACVLDADRADAIDLLRGDYAAFRERSDAVVAFVAPPDAVPEGGFADALALMPDLVLLPATLAPGRLSGIASLARQFDAHLGIVAADAVEAARAASALPPPSARARPLLLTRQGLLAEGGRAGRWAPGTDPVHVRGLAESAGDGTLLVVGLDGIDVCGGMRRAPRGTIRRWMALPEASGPCG
jgi:hypothetical protein